MLQFMALASSLLVTVALSVAGCTAPQPAPKVPFGDFEVGQFGGVAGRQTVLHVSADGLALLVSRQPAAGRLSSSTMDRLRTLLESDELRQEAAVAEADARKGPPSCADLLSTSIRMGSLRMSVEQACGSEKRPATPAFNEIISLTRPAMDGEFDSAVGDDGPRLVGLTLERQASGDRAAYRITVAPDGRSTWESASTIRRRLTLEQDDRDVLRLLLGRLVQEPTKSCQSKEYYRLTISGYPASSGPDCGYRDRYNELTAVAQLLQQALDVDP